MERKLRFECLPQLLWGKNIRSELGQAQWDIIRKKIYKKHNCRCCICGRKGKVNAHEVWKLKVNTTKSIGIQVLLRIISVCDECHDTIHIGRSVAIGENLFDKLSYYAKINNIPIRVAVEDLNYMDDKLEILNTVKHWDIDLSILDNDKYLD